MMRDVKDEIDCKLASESRGAKGWQRAVGFKLYIKSQRASNIMRLRRLT
jgi:hypothetical protein